MSARKDEVVFSVRLPIKLRKRLDAYQARLIPRTSLNSIIVGALDKELKAADERRAS